MTDEEKKEVMEQAGKRLVWQLLDDSKELSNMSSYSRLVIRKAEDCSLLNKVPTKDLRIKYGLKYDRGWTQFVWWLLEQYENGNVIIKDENIQSEP